MHNYEDTNQGGHMARTAKKVLGAGIIGVVFGVAAGLIISKKKHCNCANCTNKWGGQKNFKSWMGEMAHELRHKVRHVGDLTQDKYNEIIDSLSEKYHKLQFIKESELDDFTQVLKDKWERIKYRWQEE